MLSLLKHVPPSLVGVNPSSASPPWREFDYKFFKPLLMELDLIWGRICISLLWALVPSFLRVLPLALVRPSLFLYYSSFLVCALGLPFWLGKRRKGDAHLALEEFFCRQVTLWWKLSPFLFLLYLIIFLSLLTFWGDRGSKVVFFPFVKKMYWLLWPSCKALLIQANL